MKTIEEREAAALYAQMVAFLADQLDFFCIPPEDVYPPEAFDPILEADRVAQETAKRYKEPEDFDPER